MKKLFIAAMALATIVSCSKDEGASVLESSKKSVSIKIENMVAGSRAITPSATEANDLACATADELVFVFCDAAWNAVEARVKADATTEASSSNPGEWTFHALPQQVANVFVIANGGYSKTNYPGTKDAAETAWTTEDETEEWDDIIAYGYSETFTRVQVEGEDAFCTAEGDTKYPLYEASVRVAPAHARIEVKEISCDDLGTHDYGYKKLTVKNMILANKYRQDNIDTQFVSGTNTSVSAEGGVWSWNVLKQNVSDLVVNITVDEGNNWTIPAGTEARTVTVVDYKAPTGYANTANVDADGNLVQFVPEEIYVLKIPFLEENIDADKDYICVNVDVAIANWVVVEVTPGFQTN